MPRAGTVEEGSIQDLLAVRMNWLRFQMDVHTTNRGPHSTLSDVKGPWHRVSRGWLSPPGWLNGSTINDSMSSGLGVVVMRLAPREGLW